MRCSKCGSATLDGARFCHRCGAALVLPPAAPVGPPPQQDDWVARQVPYRNPHALAAYYVGLFSVVPCIGPLLALAAIPLGVMGLRAGKRNPALHGRAHAWTGIILAAISLLYHIVGVVLIVTLGP